MTRRRHWRRGEDGRIIRLAEPASEAEAGSSQHSAPSSPEPPAVHHANVWLALRLGLRDAYDHLGMVVLISLLWSALFGLGALFGQTVGGWLFGRLPGALGMGLIFAFGLAGVALLSGPFTAGCFRYARQAAARQEPELPDLLWGYRHAFRNSVLLCALQWSVAFLLATSVFFYALPRQTATSILAALSGYVLLFWLFTWGHQWSLLAEQALSPYLAVKKAALLVLGNFPFTLMLVGVLGLLSAVLWFTVVGGLVLWAGSMAFFYTQATRELLRKYGLLPPDPTQDLPPDDVHDLRSGPWRE